MSRPDPTLISEFCHQLLPALLSEGCEVPDNTAQDVARDVLARAEAIASLEQEQIEILAAPFIEETFDHEPDAPLWLKAATTVVVRNSRLEELHANGPVNTGGIRVITTYALAPLSHLIGARHRNPIAVAPQNNPFKDLDRKYPRAWACLSSLRRAIRQRGRLDYRPPTAPLPTLPSPDETVEAAASPDDERIVVLSAIEPRFDQHALAILQGVAAGEQDVFATPSLSRISRNSDKLLRTLEFLLAHNVRVVTTNLMLADGEVWVRRGDLVKPISARPFDGFRIMRGLSGAHRKLVTEWLKQLDTPVSE